MLTSLVCGGPWRLLPSSNQVFITARPALSAQCHRGHETAQPRMRMQICCHACSPPATAARGRHLDDWPLWWACRAPGAALCVDQPERLAREHNSKCSCRCNNLIPANWQPHGARQRCCLQQAPARRVGAAECEGCYIASYIAVLQDNPFQLLHNMLYSSVTSRLPVVT